MRLAAALRIGCFDQDRGAAMGSGGETVPLSGSGRPSLFAAVAAMAVTVLVFRIGSGHTVEGGRPSSTVAGKPTLDSW